MRMLGPMTSPFIDADGTNRHLWYPEAQEKRGLGSCSHMQWRWAMAMMHLTDLLLWLSLLEHAIPMILVENMVVVGSHFCEKAQTALR
jgi:hypothetical protein